MTLQFQKLVGAGNDFIFLSSTQVTDKNSYPTLARTLCDRHWGIGADGLVVITAAKDGEFSWDFFNDDGSAAEMCGNAARCAFLYFKNNFGVTAGTLQTSAGLVTGSLHGAQGSEIVDVSWNLASTELQTKTVALASGQKISGFFINTGVPHFVVSEPLDEVQCLAVQDHLDFAPRKTNVTLLTPKGHGFFTQSFERGVKNFTLACGTGVIAAALLRYKKTGMSQQKLETAGGFLEVKIEKNTVHLIGSARQVFSGSIVI